MIHIQALLRVVRDTLLASQQFSGVYWGEAPQDATYPYAIYLQTAGGDDNARAAKKSAAITLQITCFSDDTGAAFAGAATIDGLFDDRGEQDHAPATAPIDATGQGWHITTITAVGDVTTIERYENVKPIYQAGKEYQFVMEEV